jgi:histidine phosphotransferase ChpT
LPKNRVKLLLNMLVVAVGTIPRGGALTVDAVGAGEATGFRIAATGLNARIPQHVPDLLEGKAENGTVDAHAIQPFYTGLLAKACGLGVDLSLSGETVTVATR